MSGSQCFFLSLLGLDCFQLNIICIYFGEACLWLLHGQAKLSQTEQTEKCSWRKWCEHSWTCCRTQWSVGVPYLQLQTTSLFSFVLHPQSLLITLPSLRRGWFLIRNLYSSWTSCPLALCIISPCPCNRGSSSFSFPLPWCQATDLGRLVNVSKHQGTLC